MSNLCQACGVGFPLPSGRCDHCDMPLLPAVAGSFGRRCGECGGSGRVSGSEGSSRTCYACAGLGYGGDNEWVGTVAFDARPPPGVTWAEHRRGLFAVFVEAKAMLERYAGSVGRTRARCGAYVFALADTLPVGPTLMNFVADASLEPSDFLVVDEEHRRLVRGIVRNALQWATAPVSPPVRPPAARPREDVVEVGNVIFDCCPPSGVSWQVHKQGLYDAFAYARAMLVQKASTPVRPRAYCGVSAFAMASTLPQTGPNGVLGVVDFCEDVSVGPLDFLVVDEERRWAVRGTLLNSPVGFDEAVGEQRVQAQQVQDGRRFDLEA